MIVYDLEIANPIRPKTPDLEIPGVVYANNWQDYAGMGFAVLVAAWVDPWCRPQRFKVYGQADLWQLETDFKGHVIAGFNSKSFDDNVLACQNVEIKLEHKNLAIETHYHARLPEGKLEQGITSRHWQPPTVTPKRATAAITPQGFTSKAGGQSLLTTA
jgi:hypothetical protein